LSFDLDQRRSWPAELRVLLERHPRDTWSAAPSVGARFWLEIHDHFRHDSVGLETLAGDFHEGRKTAEQLAVMAAPRLRSMAANLHGHHEIEDFHYFPAFRRADRRVAPGIDLLEKDHAELQRTIDSALGSLQELLAAINLATKTSTSSGDPAMLAARQYAAATSKLCRHLCRHLSDEEDLVVPLLIEHPDH
jgi:hypothetical protein